MKKYFFMFIVERKYLLSPFHYESVSFVAERDTVRGAKKQNLQRFSAKNALTVGDSSEGKRFHRSEMQTMVTVLQAIHRGGAANHSEKGSGNGHHHFQDGFPCILFHITIVCYVLRMKKRRINPDLLRHLRRHCRRYPRLRPLWVRASPCSSELPSPSRRQPGP